MGKRSFIWLIMVVLAAFLLPVTTARATGEHPDDGVVIWNEDYTLAEGDVLNGDLVVFNGDTTLGSGSQVSGDAVVWNGNAYVDGVVEGNLVASNGDIELGEEAYVQGDVVCTWNCDIDRRDGARVDGETIEGPALRGLPFGQLSERGLRIQIPPSEPEPFWLSGPEQLLRWVFRVVRRVVTVLVIAAIGGVVALIWPEATAQVEHAIFRTPGTSIGVGFLTLVAALALILALTITICLSPAAALVALALSAAGLFGWIAIGARVGRELLRTLKVGEVAPLWTTGLGTLIITLITVGLSTAFCLAPLGWLLTVVIGCFGLGAVVLTRFGTTAYVPGQRQASAAPTSLPASVEESPEPATTEEEQEGLDSEDEQNA